MAQNNLTAVLYGINDLRLVSTRLLAGLNIRMIVPRFEA